MSDAADLLTTLVLKLADLERRVAGIVRYGKVKDVNPKDGTARLILGKDSNGEDVVSAWLPYGQTAGTLKVHSPPSPGQQMVALCLGGDWENGLSVPFHWSAENKSPSDKPDEHVATLGQARLTLKGDSLVVKIPKLVFDVDGVTVEVTGAGVKVTGGKITHNGKNIGATHIHGGVVPGGGTTDVPAN